VKKAKKVKRAEKNKKRFFPLLLMVVFFAFFFVSHAWASDKPYMSDVGQFNYARFLHSQGDYLRAAREFERVIELFPLSPLIPDAHFMLAESYFDAGDLKEARDQFLQFLDNSTDGSFAPFADEAQLRLLKIKELLAETEKAESPAEPGRGKPGDVKTAKKVPVEGVEPGFPMKKSLRPLRAVQVMFFSSTSYEEMERELEGLKSAGVDTVILRVFHNTGDRHHRFVKPRSPAGVYFKTDHAPVVADVLAKVLEAAHERGLRVFAWMTTRHADYGLEGMAELACKGYDITTGKIVRCRGLDMFNEEAVRHLEGLFSDLASYPIDGILFQDDLILRHTEGFGAHAEGLFKKQRGISIDPAKFYIRTTGTASVLYTASFWEWAAWKNKRLLAVAGRLKRAVRERNPRVEFVINMMYESVTNPPYALAWLSQDLSTALFDNGLPQADGRRA
jgi:hypothetical protein